MAFSQPNIYEKRPFIYQILIEKALSYQIFKKNKLWCNMYFTKAIYNETNIKQKCFHNLTNKKINCNWHKSILFTSPPSLDDFTNCSFIFFNSAFSLCSLPHSILYVAISFSFCFNNSMALVN